MISGRDTLQELVRAGDDAEERVVALERRLAEANERIVELDAARAEKLRVLAETRLGALARGAIVERLDATDERALAYLRERRARLDELEGRRASLDARLRGLEQERRAAAERLDRAAGAVDAAEARTQRRLADDPSYRARLAAAEEAERIAVHASRAPQPRLPGPTATTRCSPTSGIAATERPPTGPEADRLRACSGGSMARSPRCCATTVPGPTSRA